ncbi:acyltransferase [Pseudorhodoferax sp.]|uniref:acyltransferase n=1 Tax=Pseudorhodoferax sp. TaxID=1993553 RepID=UPI002DD67403|nr:acyltransferase [Pseudorhodoferax sp.]
MAQQRTDRTRSGGIDLVRVLGVVAVVAGHVWDTRAVAAWLYPWHVPVFFFLTGLLWKPGRPLREEWTRRWHSLAVPYLAWLALLWPVFALVLWRQDQLSLRALAAPLYGGNLATQPFTTFWFVSVLLFVALLYRALERLPRPALAVAALASLVLCALPAATRALAHSPLAIGSALGCLWCVAAGALAQRHWPRLAPHAVGLGLGGLLLGFSLVCSGLAAVPNLKSGQFGTPLLTPLAACAVSLALVLLCERLVAAAPALDRASQLAAGWALVVVIAHPVVLWVLRGEPASALKFALALVVPALLAAGLARMPAARWLAGQAAPARRARP